MLDHFAAIALEAGEVILEVYARADLGERAKADGSPVTEADAAAEAVILERLAEVWPDIPVIAEEAVCAGQVPEIRHRFFLVDPLDGTAEFVRRSGEFTVNIALVEDGRPTAGLVYLPTTGEIFRGDARGAARAVHARSGMSAWTAIRARSAPEAGLTVIASRRSGGDRLADYLDRFKVAETVRASSSLKLCRIAEGVADLYPRFGRTMAWDIAAGHAVLRAAGGEVWTLDGRPMSYEPDRVPGEDAFANPDFVASGAFDPADLVRDGGAS
ncbi:MAG: 3'(2'),5'-bisphosphate nucleotidase CysQ [Caulobacterales bacterium]|nr:3'(2'),5'-bisphosphate nucleotidase CysQ [Caulobacterales bacterium]